MYKFMNPPPAPDICGSDHWQTKPVSNGYPPGILTDKKDPHFLKKYLCSFCKNLLKEPVQNDCGHRYCRQCLESNDGKPCTNCPEESDEEECVLNYTTSFPDRGIQRGLAKLNTKCPKFGCKWVGLFADYMVHEKQCTADADGSSDSSSSEDESETEEDESKFLCPPDEQNKDGSLIWKVEDFPTKFLMAKQGMKRFQESFTFFTSGQQRYKLSAVLYPYGDGMAKGRYMSLYVRIWKGEDDEQLTWPFDRKVEMTLVNLKNPAANITEVIRPDPSSNSFEKPKSEKNIPSGIPSFCPLDCRLQKRKHGFLSGKAIYIRIKVGEPNAPVEQPQNA